VYHTCKSLFWIFFKKRPSPLRPNPHRFLCSPRYKFSYIKKSTFLIKSPKKYFFFIDWNDNCTASTTASGARYAVDTVSHRNCWSYPIALNADRTRSCVFRISNPNTGPNVWTDNRARDNDANWPDPICRIDWIATSTTTMDNWPRYSCAASRASNAYTGNRSGARIVRRRSAFVPTSNYSRRRALDAPSDSIEACIDFWPNQATNAYASNRRPDAIDKGQ